MKTLLVTILALFTFSVSAAINVEPDTGNIVATAPGYSSVVGNITDSFSYPADFERMLKKEIECSRAFSEAGNHSRTFGTEAGIYLGLGTGLSDGCGAVSIGFGAVTDYDLSFSTSFTKATENVLSKGYAVGFGLNYKF